MNPLVSELLRRDTEVWVRNLPLLTKKQAAEDLKRSLPWLEKRIRQGLVATIRRGKDQLIPRGEVMRIMVEGID
jgi:hypothetical protein